MPPGRRSNGGLKVSKTQGDCQETYRFLAVRAERLKAAAVGAPLVPGFLIRSPEPALILARLALIAAYSPGLLIYTPIWL